MILIFCAFSAELEPIRKRMIALEALNLKGLKGCYGRIGEVDQVILTGVAGALADKLEIGDVVLADRLMTLGTDNSEAGRTIDVTPRQFELASAALENARIRYARGGILTVKYPLATETDKRLAGNDTGAIAVDMETAVIAFEAAARGIPFVALRTIMDTVEHDLAGAGLADENGKVRPFKAAATLVRNPAMVAGVVRLVRNLRKATNAMAIAVDAVARRLE